MGKKDVDQVQYRCHESECARDRVKYSIVKRTTSVVSSPKRSCMEVG